MHQPRGQSLRSLSIPLVSIRSLDPPGSARFHRGRGEESFLPSRSFRPRRGSRPSCLSGRAAILSPPFSLSSSSGARSPRPSLPFSPRLPLSSDDPPALSAGVPLTVASRSLPSDPFSNGNVTYWSNEREEKERIPSNPTNHGERPR